MKKFLIFMMFLVVFSVQLVSAQKIRPLGLTFETTTHYDEAEWKWTPIVSFRVFGPIEEGSQISVDFTSPTGKVLNVKCETYPLKEDENRRIDQCGRNLEFANATNQTGVFSFQIKLGNALNGTNKILYGGKFKIGKFLYNPDGVAEKNKQFHYFVDNDFRLNYAVVGTNFGDISNDLFCQVWLKNKIMNYDQITGYLFYNSKQVAETTPGFLLKVFPKENNAESFELAGFVFPALMSEPETADVSSSFRVFKNPGEYEIKLMRDKKLARSIKFSVGADGKLVNNNIGRDLLGETDFLVPAQILGATDGTFNKLAWKDGVFGNPISNLIVQ